MQNTPALVLHNYVLQHKNRGKTDTLFTSNVYLTSFVLTAVQYKSTLAYDIFRMWQLTHQISKWPWTNKGKNGRNRNQGRNRCSNPLREHIGRTDKEIMHAIQAKTTLGQIGKGTANNRRSNPYFPYQQENGCPHQQCVRRTISKEQLHTLLTHVLFECQKK